MPDETSYVADEPTATATTTSITSEAIPEPITTAVSEPESEATTPPSETDLHPISLLYHPLHSSLSLRRHVRQPCSLSLSLSPPQRPNVLLNLLPPPPPQLLHQRQQPLPLVYDTFQSNDPSLQLFVLCFIPTISGLNLSRVPLRKPLGSFEAVLLALYAHEASETKLLKQTRCMR